MAESVTKLEAERDEARLELSETVAVMTEKVAATRAELYSPALTIGVAITAGLGFMIGSKRNHPLTPLVYAVAGYCGVEILRRARREP
jgi:hypothetical protein